MAKLSLEDKEAIRETFSRYSFYMDDGRYGDLAELFTPDGEWLAGYAKAKGRGEIESVLAQVNPSKTEGPVRKHFVVNSIIEGDSESATSRASYLVFVAREDGPEVVVAGTYEDDLVKSDGTWYFRSRRLVHDIMGDLKIRI